MPPKGRVKVGIIGSRFEADIHAESFKIMPDEAEVVAVASPTPGNAEAFARKHGLPRHFTDYRQMLAEPDIEMVTIAAPYAIWVLKQAADNLPNELDEAAKIDGATPLQLFRLVFLPLMLPSMVAVGIYAVLLAWNEYLYAFLLLSDEKEVTVAVALGHFLSADDSPWELLMATGLIYALPPAAIYYAAKRYMVSGLTAGAVKA